MRTRHRAAGTILLLLSSTISPSPGAAEGLVPDSRDIQTIVRSDLRRVLGEENSWLASTNAGPAEPGQQDRGRIAVLDDSDDPDWGAPGLLRAGDLNGDGSPDILLTRTEVALADVTADAPPTFLPAVVFLEAIDGRSGSRIWGPLHFRNSLLSEYDVWVRSLLQLDDDGVPDVVAFEIDLGLSISHLYAVSGATGSIIWTRTDVGAGVSGYRTGIADVSVAVPLGTASDFDGDGRNDFVLGKYTRAAGPLTAVPNAARRNNYGSAWTLEVERVTGRDGASIGNPKVATGIGLAPDAVPIEDATGDGLSDLLIADAIIGEPLNLTNVTLYSGDSSVRTALYRGGHTGADWGVWLIPTNLDGAGGRGYIVTFTTWNDYGFFGYATMVGVASNGTFLFKVFDVLGYSTLCMCGDVDGDGAWDLRVSGYRISQMNHYWLTNAFSGRGDQKLLWAHSATWYTPYGGTYFLLTYPAAGDLDGDGITDQIAAGGGGTGSGEYTALSGRGYTLWVAYGDFVQGGYVVPALGDLGGTSGDDAISWAQGADGSAIFEARDGRDGTLLWSVSAPGAGYSDRPFNVQIADVSGDGRDDILIGFCYTKDYSYHSRVYAIDGATHTLTWSR